MMKIQGKEMEVKILLCYFKMILEHDQNNILEAKIVMFVDHMFHLQSVSLINKPPFCMQVLVFQWIPLTYVEMKSK